MRVASIVIAVLCVALVALAGEHAPYAWSAEVPSALGRIPRLQGVPPPGDTANRAPSVASAESRYQLQPERQLIFRVIRPMTRRDDSISLIWSARERKLDGNFP